jgi:hypothetical protein
VEQQEPRGGALRLAGVRAAAEEAGACCQEGVRVAHTIEGTWDLPPAPTACLRLCHYFSFQTLQISMACGAAAFGAPRAQFKAMPCCLLPQVVLRQLRASQHLPPDTLALPWSVQVISRWLQAALSSAWSSWREHTAVQRQLKTAAARVVAKLLQGCLARAWEVSQPYCSPIHSSKQNHTGWTPPK